MYELVQVGTQTYYINCPAKMGIFKMNDHEVVLIDSGNDKDAGKKVEKILNENGWKLSALINTHSNADHIGGNHYLQEKTGCRIYSSGIESAFTQYPILEPSFLYGGFPVKELRNKFLMAAPSVSLDYRQIENCPGLEFFPLGGHFFEMIGVKTCDQVYFMADCLFGENILQKYHLSFIYDVKEFLHTLDVVETLEGKLFIPAHAEATENIRPLAQANRRKVNEIIEKILEICKNPTGFEDVLKNIFDSYSLTMDANQYVLVGSTVRSYLSYLHDQDKMEIIFSENRWLWKSKS
jgi:glyoxylase-like metal-dependent hydrolase (beta-lactamase superfamily II)